MASPSPSAPADPKKLLFTLMAAKNSMLSDTDHESDITALQNASPNMTIHDFSALPDGASVEDTILQSLKQQVLAQGTLKEIMIFGHGESERQYVDADSGFSALKNLYLERTSRASGQRKDASVALHTDVFLKKLEELQQELGIKITDRIVFAGCNVLTNLPAEKVALYRQAAQHLGTEIAGTINTMNIQGGGPFGALLGVPPQVVARFEKFTPQGTVEPDTLSNHSHFKVTTYIGDSISSLLGASLGWAECHEHKTQAEGAQCQKEKEVSSLPWQQAPTGSNLSPARLDLGQDTAKSPPKGR